MEEREKGEAMKQSNILITGPDMDQLSHMVDGVRETVRHGPGTSEDARNRA